MNFQTGNKWIGYVIIPKPPFSSREGINSLYLLLFAVLAQSVAGMTAVVTVQVVAGDPP